MKTIKFRPELVTKILTGEKTATMRLFDDKDFQVGDIATLLNKETLEAFGTATITSMKIKTLGTLTDEDWEGHERYKSDEEMYKTFKGYYGDKVNPDTEVKMMTFNFKPL